MRLLKIVFLAAVLFGSLWAKSLDEIKAAGVVRIGVFSDKAPFGYVDSKGEYQGYDVYFAKRIAQDWV